MNDGLVEIVMFSGGRGTTALANAFKRHAQIHITVVVNAYDDGLSTGGIRKFIPGMLGPSDIRKNISSLIDTEDSAKKALKDLIEYRLPIEITTEDALSILRAMVDRNVSGKDKTVDECILLLNTKLFNSIAAFAQMFLDYYTEQVGKNRGFDFGDCSIGNILFAGCYLQCNQDFNRATECFSNFAEIRHRVENVTDGKNLVLLGIKADGTVLSNEAQIVSPQNDQQIKDIFLLEDYLTLEQNEQLEKLNKEQKNAYLLERSVRPPLDSKVRYYINNADIIIYGPGTQHSSLLPSYLTQGLAEAIANNNKAQKIFVSNLYKDVEIKSETANSLAAKLHYYMNDRGRDSIPHHKLVSKYFFQLPRDIEGRNKDYVRIDQAQFPFTENNVLLSNWESDQGSHIGGRVLAEIVALTNISLQRNKYYHYMVSIIVPCLNESNTITKVLEELVLLDFSDLHLAKEIIYVDGGSVDGSLEKAKRFENVRVLEDRCREGRGAAIRLGMQNAAGNIVAIFPSDNEYQPQDLKKLVNAIVSDGFKAAFGSRVTKCVDLNNVIATIYRGNRLLYFLSKYGGYAISFLSLLLYNRYVTDALTGLKAFDSEVLKSLKLESKGVELETEIVAKLARRGYYFVEIPVNFQPRTQQEGKKITTLDGIKAILKLIQCKIT